LLGVDDAVVRHSFVSAPAIMRCVMRLSSLRMSQSVAITAVLVGCLQDDSGRGDNMGLLISGGLTLIFMAGFLAGTLYVLNVFEETE